MDEQPTKTQVDAYLIEFRAAAEQLWNEYRQCGPGRVSPDRYAAVADAWHRLESSSATKLGLDRESLQRLLQLAHQAVLKPEGLCFVTGEAGFIPRRDLYAEFEQLLAACGEAIGRERDATHQKP